MAANAAAPVPLVAIKMPKASAGEAVRKARDGAKSKQRNIHPNTVIAAEWVILVTSLDWSEFAVLELYHLRWRIEIAFKRMKSLAGLAGPPGECPEVAKVWVLCHLIAERGGASPLSVTLPAGPPRTSRPAVRFLPADRVAPPRNHSHSQARRRRRRFPAAHPPLARAAPTTTVSGNQVPKLPPMGSDPGRSRVTCPILRPARASGLP